MPLVVHCPNPACRAGCSVVDASWPVRCSKCGKTFVAKPTLDGQMVETKKGQPASNANPFPVLPAEFGRYRVLKLLGKGGMGAVYLAEDTQLGRPVALKMPFFDASNSAQRVERFIREARSAAILHHPNICTVFDVGEIDGRPFLTMAYIAGSSLANEIDPDQPMPQRRAAEIVRKIALALEHAHGKGTVHRDLKPANVMIGEDGEPVVMDFGLAKRVADVDPSEAKLTHIGGIVGTPSYMSPEQAKGETIGPATDIYSLGVILFEMLTGKTPYSGPHLGIVIGQILAAPVPPVKEFRPDVASRLDAICGQAMAKEAGARFPSMAMFAVALGQYLEPAVPPSQPTPIAHRADPAPIAYPVPKAPSPEIARSAPPPVKLPRAVPVAPTPPLSYSAVPVDISYAPRAVPVPFTVQVERVPSPEVARSSPPPSRIVERSAFDDLENATAFVPASRRRRKWPPGAVALALALFMVVVVILAVVILRPEPPSGTLIIEMNDAETEARFKTARLILTGPDGKSKSIVIAPGERRKKLEKGRYKVRHEGGQGKFKYWHEVEVKKGETVTIPITATPQ